MMPQEPPAIRAYDIEIQRLWSLKAFGPGHRTEGVLDHIRKELDEIHDDPLDLEEWIDVVILALDGAWRAGWRGDEIVRAYHDKVKKNREREWPDWRTADPNKAIEHERRFDGLEHSPTCTPTNRTEGWYPVDCKLCEAVSEKLNLVGIEKREI